VQEAKNPKELALVVLAKNFKSRLLNGLEGESFGNSSNVTGENMQQMDD